MGEDAHGRIHRNRCVGMDVQGRLYRGGCTGEGVYGGRLSATDKSTTPPRALYVPYRGMYFLGSKNGTKSIIYYENNVDFVKHTSATTRRSILYGVKVPPNETATQHKPVVR